MIRNKLLVTLSAIFICGLAIAQDSASNYSYVNVYKSEVLGNNTSDTSAFILQRKQVIAMALAKKQPILLEPGRNKSLNDSILLAENIALKDTNFSRFLTDVTSKKALLNQIFGVYYARQSVIPKGVLFEKGRYFQVEMYNFAYNLSTIAVIDMKDKKAILVNTLTQTQPDVPNAIARLGIEIAINSKEVEKALGFKPSINMPVMSNTKTALNKTRCERSMHLCLAPTFVVKDRALWAIVDITEMKLVGVRWTNLGNNVQNAMLTERKIQNETIQDCFCEKVNTVTKHNWKVDYILTSSDGLKIFDVTYRDKQILNSAKLVDWHVSYSNTDGFGYSDAVGCPIFSQSAVVATEPPQIFDFVDEDNHEKGFILEQKFYSEMYPTPCNYSYSQRYLFYDNGDFRVIAASLGRGCGNDGTYRPVIRVEFTGDNQQFKEWNKTDWSVWNNEGWQLQKPTTSYTKEGYQYAIQPNADATYFIQPSTGQFKDGGRGDNAYLYVTKNHPELQEGYNDLITIGPCCNTDYRQGPEKFIEPNPETITNSSIVLWYVPQMKNDDTPGAEYCWANVVNEDGIFKIKASPCFAGPKFIYKPITTASKK
jgi:hypothetical protein